MSRKENDVLFFQMFFTDECCSAHFVVHPHKRSMKHSKWDVAKTFEITTWSWCPLTMMDIRQELNHVTVFWSIDMLFNLHLRSIWHDDQQMMCLSQQWCPCSNITMQIAFLHDNVVTNASWFFKHSWTHACLTGIELTKADIFCMSSTACSRKHVSSFFKNALHLSVEENFTCSVSVPAPHDFWKDQTQFCSSFFQSHDMHFRFWDARDMLFWVKNAAKDDHLDVSTHRHLSTLLKNFSSEQRFSRQCCFIIEVSVCNAGCACGCFLTIQVHHALRWTSNKTSPEENNAKFVSAVRKMSDFVTIQVVVYQCWFKPHDGCPLVLNKSDCQQCDWIDKKKSLQTDMLTAVSSNAWPKTSDGRMQRDFNLDQSQVGLSTPVWDHLHEMHEAENWLTWDFLSLGFLSWNNTSWFDGHLGPRGPNIRHNWQLFVASTQLSHLELLQLGPKCDFQKHANKIIGVQQHTDWTLQLGFCHAPNRSKWPSCIHCEFMLQWRLCISFLYDPHFPVFCSLSKMRNEACLRTFSSISCSWGSMPQIWTIFEWILKKKSSALLIWLQSDQQIVQLFGLFWLIDATQLRSAMVSMREKLRKPSRSTSSSLKQHHPCVGWSGKPTVVCLCLFVFVCVVCRQLVDPQLTVCNSLMLNQNFNHCCESKPVSYTHLTLPTNRQV